MKIPSVAAIQAPALAITVAFFTSILDLTLGRAQLMPVQPTYLALVLVLLFLTLRVLAAIRSPAYQREFSSTLRKHLVPLCFYGLVAVFSIAFGFVPGALWEENGKWIFLISYGFVVWLGVLLICTDERMQSSAIQGLKLGFLMISLSVVYEVFYPGTLSNLSARAAGFAGNANWSPCNMHALRCCAVVQRCTPCQS